MKRMYETMLYRPNYCANCGEKIERIDWGILTSRRFCGVCETEFKGTDILVRGIVVGGLLIGVIGVGGYLRSGSQPEPTVSRQPTKDIERAAKQETKPQTNENSAVPAKTPDLATSPPVQQLGGPRPANPVKTEIAEAQYYCGAETKKGTPCSRRVKGNTRCYQHMGMPAMANSDRLKIN